MQDRQTYDDAKGKSTGDSANVAQQQHTVGSSNRVSKFSDEPPKQSLNARQNDDDNVGYRQHGKVQERFRQERSRSRDKNPDFKNRDQPRTERPPRKQSNFDKPPEEYGQRSRGGNGNPSSSQGNQIQYGGSRYREQMNTGRGADSNNPERDHHRQPRNAGSNENSSDLNKERAPRTKEADRIPFDFKLLVKNEDREEFDSKFLDTLVKQTNCYDVLFEDKYKIPEYPGSVLVIKSKLLQQKADALLTIVRKFELAEMQIFVPEALVSIVIGVKGRSINQLKRETSCDIVVQQPVIGLSDRLITLKNPSPRILASAARQIYDLIECQASEDDLKQVVAKPLSKTELQTTAKFVISEKSMGYLIGKGGSFTKQLDDRKIYMHCGREQQNRALHSKEAVCSLKGSLADIETSIEPIVKRLASYYESSGKDYREVPLAVLIPYNMVTKIIGAGGCLIKELVLKTGAQIRVNSSKNDPKIEEIVVTIDGNLEQKRRGAQAILSQIELFKNGGPILENGQGWNSDMGTQMKNSIHFGGEQQSSRKQQEGDERNEGSEDYNKYQNQRDRKDNYYDERRKGGDRPPVERSRNALQNEQDDINDEPEATWNNNSDCEEKVGGYGNPSASGNQRVKDEPMQMQGEDDDQNYNKSKLTVPEQQQYHAENYHQVGEEDRMAEGEFTPTPDVSLNNVGNGGGQFGKADTGGIRETSNNQQETKMLDSNNQHQTSSLRRNLADQQDDFMQEFEHSVEDEQQFRQSAAAPPQQSNTNEQQTRRSSQQTNKNTTFEPEVEVYIRKPHTGLAVVPEGIHEKERNCFVIRGADASQICNKFRSLIQEMEKTHKTSSSQQSYNNASHQRNYQSKNYTSNADKSYGKRH